MLARDELMDRPVLATPAAAYGMLDGVFQQALLAVGTGSDTALDTLDEQVHALMPLLLGPTTPAHHG